MERAQKGFRFGPFRYESEIDLTELGLVEDYGGLGVRVRRGHAPEVPGMEAVSATVSACPEGCRLRVPTVGVFTILGKEQVWVEEEPGADAGDVRGYLTAWVFGALCHGNGLLPLHASAVERDGVCVAFCGDSGTGKSTLAAYLAGRGSRVQADDICLLDGREILPVASWLKLWRRSLDALGKPVEEETRTFSSEDKYRVRVEGEALAGQALRHVVFPERGDEAALERLSGTEAVARMVGSLYLGYVLAPMGIEERVLAQCARVLDDAEAWVLRVPWGFDRMDEVATLVEEELLGRKGPRI